MSFNAPYVFGISNHVVIKHSGGKYLRVSPNNTSLMDPNGGTGLFAQWNIEKINNRDFKLRSTKTGKYLRILQNGTIDCQGGGGPWTVFHAHGTGNIRKLESAKVPGKYIAVRNGQVVFGTGGPFCALTFFRKGQPQQQQQQFIQQQQHHVHVHQQPKQPFTQPYMFAVNNTVVMKHGGGKFVRISPNNLTILDGNGGKGGFAQWYVEKHNNKFKFKSLKSGKYLRIDKHGSVNCGGSGGKWCLFKCHGNGNIRKLEAVNHHGKYIAFRQGQVTIGTGGPFCAFTFYRN